MIHNGSDEDHCYDFRAGYNKQSQERGEAPEQHDKVLHQHVPQTACDEIYLQLLWILWIEFHEYFIVHAGYMEVEYKEQK